MSRMYLEGRTDLSPISKPVQPLCSTLISSCPQAYFVMIVFGFDHLGDLILISSSSSRRHYFAWHAIDITNPAGQRLDCRCAPESLGIAELRTIAILMLDDLTPQDHLAVDRDIAIVGEEPASSIDVSYLTQESRLLLVGIDATLTSRVWCRLAVILPTGQGVGVNGRILVTARFNFFTRHVDRVVAEIGKEVRIHEVPLSPADDGFSDVHYAGSLTGSAGCTNGTSFSGTGSSSGSTSMILSGSPI